MDILEEIVAYKKGEVEEQKMLVPMKEMEARAVKAMRCPVPSMRQALMQSSTGIIAEVKRKSPSKGWINREAVPSVVARGYEQAGASALSVLTDEHFFGGRDEFVRDIKVSGVRLPILYKNFVIDSYQLYEARWTGVSAVLLIAACLTKDECRRLLDEAHALGLEVLLEMHSDRDLQYAELEPDMYGINNRNLGTFITDVANSFRLADRLPKGVCKVSESGIKDADTILCLREAGFRGFLIGERFMREADPGAALKSFINGIK